MVDAEPDYTRHLGRNLLASIAVVYAATTGGISLVLDELAEGAAIAVVPALFAGPYVGILVTLVSAVRRSTISRPRSS